jgi:hypothetical protein
MRDLLPGWAHLSFIERDRERQEAFFLFRSPGNRGGARPAALAGRGDAPATSSSGGVAGGPRASLSTHSSARGGLLWLAHELRRRAHGGSIGGANRRRTWSEKGRVRGGVRRARWCYAWLRTRRLVGGRTPAAMELGMAGYGGGAAAQLEAGDSRRSNRQGLTTCTRGREVARSMARAGRPRALLANNGGCGRALCERALESEE